MTDYYVLSEIKCKGLKPGIIHDFHKSLRGRKCYMITCEKVLETIEENDTYE